MTKLIVQIPCYNEEDTLPQTYADIPREIEGIDIIEVLIIDDGSTDRTIEVARELGIDHIVINKQNVGLARTFRHGLQACLEAGADIIVNTDGDNQYAGKDIPKLIKPVLAGEADIVVGDRETHKVAHFSKGKKFMQAFGTAVVRRLARVWVGDAVSGFRAISREAATRLNVLSTFSYTIEMLIQAGKRDLKVISVPIETNSKTRESRLFKSIPDFVNKQLTTIIRMYAMYQPLKVFFLIGTLFSVIGLVPIFRFLFYYFTTGGVGHLQSLILGGVFLTMGFLAYMIGLVADLISFNRQLSEMILERVKKLELSDQQAQKEKQEKSDS